MPLPQRPPHSHLPWEGREEKGGAHGERWPPGLGHVLCAWQPGARPLTPPQGSGAHESSTPSQRPLPGPPARLTSHQTPSGWRGTSWSPCCTWWTSGISKHPKNPTSARAPERTSAVSILVTHTPPPRPQITTRSRACYGVSASHTGPHLILWSKSIPFRDEENGAQRGEAVVLWPHSWRAMLGVSSLQYPYLATFQSGKNQEGHGCSEPREPGGRVLGT